MTDDLLTPELRKAVDEVLAFITGGGDAPPPRGGRGSVHRNKKYCKWGHPYAGHNLIITNLGRRRCRVCSNASGRLSRQENRVKQRQLRKEQS